MTSTFDWTGLEAFLTDRIITLVQSVRTQHDDVTVHDVTVSDFYAEKMLILWPTISVSFREGPSAPGEPLPVIEHRWQFDSIRGGDEWAERLTAFAGSAGHEWDAVVTRFFDGVVRACRIATTTLVESELVAGDFVAVARVDGDDDLIVRCLTPAQLARSFPRLHRRKCEIERLAILPTDQRIRELLDSVVAPVSNSTIDRGLAARMLEKLGRLAGAAVAERIRTSADPEIELFSVIERIGDNAPVVVDPLITIMADDSAAVSLRCRAACSIAFLGRLDAVVTLSADLPDSVVYQALSTLYLGECKNGPLDYAPLESALSILPHLNDPLFAALSPNRMYEIDAADVATAVAALSSPWPVVRRHAAIVMLSVHT